MSDTPRTQPRPGWIYGGRRLGRWAPFPQKQCRPWDHEITERPYATPPHLAEIHRAVLTVPAVLYLKVCSWSRLRRHGLPWWEKVKQNLLGACPFPSDTAPSLTAVVTSRGRGDSAAGRGSPCTWPHTHLSVNRRLGSSLHLPQQSGSLFSMEAVTFSQKWTST